MGISTVIAKAAPFAPARERGALDRARDACAWLHRALNLTIIAGVPLQFYLAGAMLFGAVTITPHRTAGFLLLAFGLLSLAFAGVAGPARAAPGLASIVFVLLALQPVFATALRNVAPAIAGLHAVNGLAIIAVALLIERRARGMASGV